MTRRKHHWGALGDFRGVYCERLQGLDQPIDALVECFSSDREIERLPAYERELGETVRFAPDCRRARSGIAASSPIRETARCATGSTRR